MKFLLKFTTIFQNTGATAFWIVALFCILYSHKIYKKLVFGFDFINSEYKLKEKDPGFEVNYYRELKIARAYKNCNSFVTLYSNIPNDYFKVYGVFDMLDERIITRYIFSPCSVRVRKEELQEIESDLTLIHISHPDFKKAKTMQNSFVTGDFIIFKN
jgi:hypothetical protein